MPDRGQLIGGAGSDRDQMIGRLLERSEALMSQHDDFKMVLSRLDVTMEQLGRTVAKLEGALELIASRVPDSERLEARLARVEIELAPITAAKKKIVLGAITVALISLTWGTVAGTILRTSLGLH